MRRCALVTVAFVVFIVRAAVCSSLLFCYVVIEVGIDCCGVNAFYVLFDVSWCDFISRRANVVCLCLECCLLRCVVLCFVLSVVFVCLLWMRWVTIWWMRTQGFSR